MTQHITTKRAAALLLAGALLAIASSASLGWASIPSDDGTISACKDQKGSLKVIDTGNGQTCGGNQQLLQWQAAGSSVAYARILPPEPGNVPLRVDAARSSSTITAANVVHPGTGTYCLGGLPFTPRSIAVTPGLGIGLDEPGVAIFARGDVTGLTFCPDGFKQAQITTQDSALTARDIDVYVVLYR